MPTSRSAQISDSTREVRRILERLPALLRKDESFRVKLWEVLDSRFATRTDLGRILREMERSRQDTAKRFEDLREESNRRFKAVDDRFDALIKELHDFREDTNRRFEAVDRRFDALIKEFHDFREDTNRRFEEGDRRFDALIKEFHDFREDTNRRFEAVDRRFEAADRRFESLLAELRALREGTRQDFQDLKDWVNGVVGGFQVRAGRNLEDMVAGTLRIALGMKSVDPSKITMRRKVVDTRGRIGPAGRTYEIDIVATNGETWIFEIKSVADREDVERFNDKAEFAIEALGVTSARKALITLGKVPEVMAVCQTLGIVLG